MYFSTLEEKKVRLSSIKYLTWSKEIHVFSLYVLNLASSVHYIFVNTEIDVERRAYFELHLEPVN